MDIKELSTKSKDFSLAIIEANDQAAKATIKAINTLLGSEYATYTYGLTFVADHVTKNAREIVEKCSEFAYAGHKR